MLRRVKIGSLASARRPASNRRRACALLTLTLLLGGCRASEPDEPQGMGGNSSSPDAMGGSNSSPDGTGGNLDYALVDCPKGLVGFAEEIVQASWGEGEEFGHDQLPGIVLGGPRGGGCCAGSLDVASLGNGGHVVLGFGERSIIDGPGADFLVFENGFWVGGDEELGFLEFGRVEVSEDGKQWFAFPCDEVTGDGCAGTRPTFAHPEEPELDVFDPEQAGGDAFDLNDLGLKSARYVRVSDIPDDDMGFDLDAVGIVHGKCN
jgi:hypothetical protein